MTLALAVVVLVPILSDARPKGSDHFNKVDARKCVYFYHGSPRYCPPQTRKLPTPAAVTAAPLPPIPNPTQRAASYPSCPTCPSCATCPRCPTCPTPPTTTTMAAAKTTQSKTATAVPTTTSTHRKGTKAQQTTTLASSKTAKAAPAKTTPKPKTATVHPCTTASTGSTTAPIADCSPIWTPSLEPGSTTEFAVCKNPNNLNWIDVEKVCVSYGGHLATFHNTWELDIILAKWYIELSFKADCLFVGYNRSDTADWKYMNSWIEPSTPGPERHVDKTLVDWMPDAPNNLPPGQPCSRLRAPFTTDRPMPTSIPPEPGKVFPLPLPLFDDVWCLLRPTFGDFTPACNFACRRP